MGQSKLAPRPFLAKPVRTAYHESVKLGEENGPFHIKAEQSVLQEILECCSDHTCCRESLHSRASAGFSNRMNMPQALAWNVPGSGLSERVPFRIEESVGPKKLGYSKALQWLTSLSWKVSIGFINKSPVDGPQRCVLGGTLRAAIRQPGFIITQWC